MARVLVQGDWQDVHMRGDALEAARRAFCTTQEALHTARRDLASAVLSTYMDGEPVTHIAEHADL